MSRTARAGSGPSGAADPDTDAGAGDGQSPELAEGEIHEILRNDRRRLTIRCLQEAEEGRLPVGELSDRVATIETGEDSPPSDKRQSVYVSLQQTHLPKLDNHGIVRYDDVENEVLLGDRVSEVEVYMQVVPRYGLSWGEYYFALGLLGMLSVLAAVVGAPGVSRLGIAPIATAFFALFMLSAAYHVYVQQDRLLFQRVRDA